MVRTVARHKTNADCFLSYLIDFESILPDHSMQEDGWFSDGLFTEWGLWDYELDALQDG